MTILTLYDQAMLRGARSAPVIARLGGGTISAIADNQPYRAVGNNAVIYQLRQATGKVVGLRCWLSETVPAELLERYRALGHPETLRRLRSAEHSPIVASLGIHAEGVATLTDDLRSEPHPVVTIDWLMGPTLLAAVDRASQSGDQSYLSALANAWRQAVAGAEAVGFVHGDLAPDNAILRPKEGIAFVDYDTAYWSGAPTVPTLSPTPAYQHPRGSAATPERADDFAALVVYVSLRILSIWPALRAEHGQPATVKGAALLFQPRDLASPDGSALFGKLRVIDEPSVQGLVGILRETCLADAGTIPTFAEAVDLATNVSRTRANSEPTTGIGSRVGSIITNAASVVRETKNRGTDRLKSKPELVQETESWPEPQRNWRPERLTPLLDALQTGNLASAEANWDKIQNETGATALFPALHLLRTRASGSRPDVAAATRIADERAARDLVRRETIQRRFSNAIDQDDREVLADLALSGDLDEIGELTEASTRHIVATLAASHFERAVATDDDVLIIDAYDEGLLGEKGLLTTEQHNRVELAFDRRGWLSEMRSAIRASKMDRIEGLLATMPSGASDRLRAREVHRIERLRNQFRAIDQLRKAIDDDQDAEVVQAFQLVERIGATIPKDLPWSKISDVISRYGLIVAIRRAAEQQPMDLARIGRLLPQIKVANGGTYPDLGGSIDFAMLDMEVQRAAQIVRVREALAGEDDRKIVSTALPDLFNVLPLLDRNEQARIERAVAAVTRALRRSGQRTNRSASSSETDVAIAPGPAS